MFLQGKKNGHFLSCKPQPQATTQVEDILKKQNRKQLAGPKATGFLSQSALRQEILIKNPSEELFCKSSKSQCSKWPPAAQERHLIAPISMGYA